ncbi:NUDIX domain-containing protein [[Eubacterium] cellulosolvens]
MMSANNPLVFFKQNMIYKRSDIHQRFGGQSQGGISTPSQFPVIFLFHTSKGKNYGYQDGWNDDGTYLYSGEGTRGDMKFEKGNRAIRDHLKNKEHLLLFEERARGYYRFLGIFDCIAYTYSETIDEQKNIRQGIVFQLLLTTAFEEGLEPPKDDFSIPLIELRKKAIQAADSSPSNKIGRKSVSTYYARSEEVARYVKKRALGFCEGCGKPAPFLTKSGIPYLEPHHTIRRADRGPDSPNTVIALCPNCHKRIDNGKDGNQFNEFLKKRVKFIEDKIAKNAFSNVAAAIIVDNNYRVLIAKRRDKDEIGGCWEFVGGTIKEGEDLKTCLKREIFEELTITIEDIDPFYAVYYDYGDFTIRLFSGITTQYTGNIVLKDHSQFKWIARGRAHIDPTTLKSYPLCSADKLILKQLYRYNQRQPD